MDSREDPRKFPETIGAKETRKLKARREAHHSIWFGMGMFGVVGWSVAVPTVLGVIIGAWIDRSWPSHYSWTLMLLFMGVILGGLNAWFWLQQEGGVERNRRTRDDA